MKRTLLAFAFAGCVGTATIHGTATTSGSLVVYKQPPAPQIESASRTERPGYVWVRGRWDWRNGQWFWIDGRWEKVRTGHAWRDGRWEQRGNEWHWIDGRWVVSGGGEVRDHREEVVRDHRDDREVHDHRDGHADDDDYGDREPPAPKAETPGTRAGHVWVTGRWTWKRGQWVWVEGRWEASQPNKRWVEGRWERKGRRSVWVEGHWE